MLNKNFKDKIYINLFLVLLSFAIFYFLVLPIYNGSGNNIFGFSKSLKMLLQEKSDYQSALLKMNSQFKKIESINTSYNSISNNEKISELKNMIPTQVDPVEVINELSALSLRSIMRLSSPRFIDDSKNTQNNYNTLTIDFSIQGNYQQLKSFLRDLENSKRIFNTKSVSFSTSADSKAASPIIYQISLETYYLK